MKTDNYKLYKAIEKVENTICAWPFFNRDNNKYFREVSTIISILMPGYEVEVWEYGKTDEVARYITENRDAADIQISDATIEDGQVNMFVVAVKP